MEEFQNQASSFLCPFVLCIGLPDVHSYRINVSTTLTETELTLTCNSDRQPKNITSWSAYLNKFFPTFKFKTHVGLRIAVFEF